MKVERFYVITKPEIQRLLKETGLRCDNIATPCESVGTWVNTKAIAPRSWHCEIEKAYEFTQTLPKPKPPDIIDLSWEEPFRLTKDENGLIKLPLMMWYELVKILIIRNVLKDQEGIYLYDNKGT